MTTATSTSLSGALRWGEAITRGVSPGRLRGPSWRRITHGVYAPSASTPDLAALAAATAVALPRDSGFGHLTSVGLRGWWLPNGLGPSVLFASTTSRVHVQRKGLYVRRSAYARTDLVGGLPVICPSETLLELAQDLSLVDLVPLVDCALAAGTAASDVLAAARPRSRGSRVLRRAVALADPRSESWWESVLRLMHVATELGPVQCQVPLWSGPTFVARADLHLVGTSRYPECDGGEHRSRDRHAHDLRRDKALQRAGAERYGYTTAEIAHHPQMIIRDAEVARAWQHDPERVARWWRLARTSTLTGHGRARLRARLDRYRRAALR